MVTKMTVTAPPCMVIIEGPAVVLKLMNAIATSISLLASRKSHLRPPLAAAMTSTETNSLGRPAYQESFK